MLFQEGTIEYLSPNVLGKRILRLNFYFFFIFGENNLIPW